MNKLFGSETDTRLASLVSAFKVDTNANREAPAIRICQDLLEEGAQVTIHDLKVAVDPIGRALGLGPSSDGQVLSGEGCWQPYASAPEAVRGAEVL